MGNAPEIVGTGPSSAADQWITGASRRFQAFVADLPPAAGSAGYPNWLQSGKASRPMAVRLRTTPGPLVATPIEKMDSGAADRLQAARRGLGTSGSGFQASLLRDLLPDGVVLHHVLRAIRGFHGDAVAHLDAIARGIDVGHGAVLVNRQLAAVLQLNGLLPHDLFAHLLGGEGAAGAEGQGDQQRQRCGVFHLVLLRCESSEIPALLRADTNRRAGRAR